MPSDSAAAKADSSSEEHNHAKSREHTKGGGAQPQNAFPLIVVILACVAAICLPVTVSLILVLRSRGLCCASAKFRECAPR